MGRILAKGETGERSRKGRRVSESPHGFPIEYDTNQAILHRVDYEKSKQFFFHLGASAVFLSDLAGITGRSRFLDASREEISAEFTFELAMIGGDLTVREK